MSEGGGGRERKNISSAPPPTRHCTKPLPVKRLITIQDGGIESLIYLAFRSKITPALQAIRNRFLQDSQASVDYVPLTETVQP